MKQGIINEKNKEKIISLFEILNDVINDDNICDGICNDCCYSYTMLYDLYSTCHFMSIYYYLSKELEEEIK